MLSTRKTIGLKLEGTPYTAENLAQSDFNFKAKNIQYSTEIEEYKRPYATGDFNKFASVMGKSMFTCSFVMDLAIGTTAGAVPAWGKLLKAAGLEENDAGSDIYYRIFANGARTPCTIEIVEIEDGTSPSQLVIKAKGCMAKSVKLVCDGVGQPVQLQFEFHGSLVSVSDRAYGSILIPDQFDNKLPPTLMSATVEFDSVALPLDKFTIDLGINGQLESNPADASGIKGAYVADFNPTFVADPKMQLLAVDNFYTKWKAGTLGALNIVLGSTITLYAPKMQLVKAYNPGDRGGLVTNNIEAILTRSVGEGDDETGYPFYIKLT